ncbi:hypothetical protein EV178_002213 [Coemansia sp. RSA 1646]|nr:hypothetical protein EV178_002213 [Coemansia sp. RSA 1646]
MPKLNLEQKLSKWAEHPEDDEDDDYGLIIDDSVTTEPPGLPKFGKAGSCSQLPTSTAFSPLALLPANLHTLKPARAAAMNRPPAKSFASTRDLLQRYAETPEDDNYDDLVIPEEEEELDRQLADWKTPRPRDLDWSNPSNGQVLLEDITMSGATAVEHGVQKPESGAPPPTIKATSYTPTPPASYTTSAVSRPRAMTSFVPPAASRELPTLGLNLMAAGGERPTRRQQKVASSRQRLLEWQQKQEQQQTQTQRHHHIQQPPQQQQQQQQQRPTRRPMLIRNTQRATEPLVIGCMRYDPVRRIWIGNEEEGSRIANAIAESERQLRSGGVARNERPLDTDKLARKISQRAGNPNLVPALPEDMDIDGPDHAVASAAITSDHSQKVFWHQPISPAKNSNINDGSGGLRPKSSRSPIAMDATAAGRPALISPAAAAAAIAGVAGSKSADGDACRRARPIFDPQNLRWIDPNEEETRGPHGNPFWNITDLPLEPLPIDSIQHKSRLRSASEAIGVENNRNCFVLTEDQIETYHRESIDYAAFARHWFPKSSST